MNADENVTEILKRMSVFLKDREMLLSRLTEITLRLDKHYEGLRSMSKTVESGSEENVKKQLKNCMLATAELCETVGFLNVLAVAYVSGQFNSDASKLAMNAGADPMTVLKAMYKNKFGKEF